jgi:hypothetical protein
VRHSSAIPIIPKTTATVVTIIIVVIIIFIKPPDISAHCCFFMASCASTAFHFAYGTSTAHLVFLFLVVTSGVVARPQLRSRFGRLCSAAAGFTGRTRCNVIVPIVIIVVITTVIDTHSSHPSTRGGLY